MSCKSWLPMKLPRSSVRKPQVYTVWNFNALLGQSQDTISCELCEWGCLICYRPIKPLNEGHVLPYIDDFNDIHFLKSVHVQELLPWVPHILESLCSQPLDLEYFAAIFGSNSALLHQLTQLRFLKYLPITVNNTWSHCLMIFTAWAASCGTTWGENGMFAIQLALLSPNPSLHE